MTQEEKELLLKDLCGRLLYGVKYQDRIEGGVHILTLGTISHYERFIPYLRPMSSMTKDEYEEFKKLDKRSMHRCIVLDGIDLWFDKWEIIEWFNSHHFDYRGLIEKGLALEAPKEMYKF